MCFGFVHFAQAAPSREQPVPTFFFFFVFFCVSKAERKIKIKTNFGSIWLWIWKVPFAKVSVDVEIDQENKKHIYICLYSEHTQHSGGSYHISHYLIFVSQNPAHTTGISSRVHENIRQKHWNLSVRVWRNWNDEFSFKFIGFSLYFGVSRKTDRKNKTSQKTLQTHIQQNRSDEEEEAHE